MASTAAVARVQPRGTVAEPMLNVASEQNNLLQVGSYAVECRTLKQVSPGSNPFCYISKFGHSRSFRDAPNLPAAQMSTCLRGAVDM